MYKYLLLIFVFIFASTAAYSADDKEFRIYISNQSFSKPQKEIVLKVNGKELYNNNLPVKNQHYHKSFTVSSKDSMKQWIHIKANDTNVSAGIGIDTSDINNDIWISIEFWYNKEEKRGFFTFVTGHGPFLID